MRWVCSVMAALSLVTAPALEPVTVAEARRQLLMNSASGEPAPPKPTLALASPAAAGNCDNGVWQIGFTFVTADGETTLGDLETVTVADKTVNGQIAISGIPLGGASVTARKGYAIAPGQTVAKLFATIADNETETYALNAAAASLGAQAPSANTTASPELILRIQDARERAELATRRAFITQTWDQVRDGFPAGDVLSLPKPPLQSVTWIKYRDTAGVWQTWPASNYTVEAPSGPTASRGRIVRAAGVAWPSTDGRPGDVSIRFVCGYGATAADVPARLRAAMLMDLATMYSQRESVVTGTIVAELPAGPASIYRSFRSHG